MSFTSIPVIANDKNKPDFFFFIEKFFNEETAIKRTKKSILSSNHIILTKLYVGNVYN